MYQVNLGHLIRNGGSKSLTLVDDFRFIPQNTKLAN